MWKQDIQRKGVKITVSDQVFVNPAPYDAVSEVLHSIGQYRQVWVTGEDSREWLSVTMDGSPYLLARNLIENTHICFTCVDGNCEIKPYFGKEWQRHRKTKHQDCDVQSVRDLIG